MALRCFIAVRIPDEIKQSIGRVIDALSITGADVKWVNPANIHVTLKFLGNTDEQLVGPISAVLEKKISSYAPFYIKIAGVGSFPDRKRPRVIWIGIRDSGELKSLQQDIDIEMIRFGYAAEDRPFSPHLTIGRVRSGKKSMEMLKALESFNERDFGQIEIKGVALMKSELKSTGAEYLSLAEIFIKGRKHGE